MHHRPSLAVFGPRWLNLGDVQLDDNEPHGLGVVDYGPREVVREVVVLGEVVSEEVVEVEEADDLVKHVSLQSGYALRPSSVLLRALNHVPVISYGSSNSMSLTSLCAGMGI